MQIILLLQVCSTALMIAMTLTWHLQTCSVRLLLNCTAQRSLSIVIHFPLRVVPRLMLSVEMFAWRTHRRRLSGRRLVSNVISSWRSCFVLGSWNTTSWKLKGLIQRLCIWHRHELGLLSGIKLWLSWQERWGNQTLMLLWGWWAGESLNRCILLGSPQLV